MCLTSCNTFQKHLLSQKENLIFWPQKWIFEISEAIFDSFWHPNMRKRHCKATLKVSKKIWDLQSKIVSIRLFQMFWGLIWYHSRGHTTKIDFGKRSRLKKKAKTPAKWTFWNNRLHLLTKIFLSLKSTKSPLQNPIFRFFISLMVPEISSVLFQNTAIAGFQITTFKCNLWFVTFWAFNIPISSTDVEEKSKNSL